MMGDTSFCRVRLYKTSSTSGAYIDLYDIQGPTLKYVENYGVTGNLTIVNDIYTSSRNLLSSSCTLWSTGSGAISTGMYLHIWKDSMTDANKLGVFMITELTPSDDTIAVTFGDAIQILRATGADYFRNHYDAGQQHNNEPAFGGWDESAERLYVTKPENVTLNAANGDVQWAVSTEYSQNTANGYGFVTETGYVECQFDVADGDYLLGFSIMPQDNLSGLNCRIRVWINDVLILTQNLVTAPSVQPFTFAEGEELTGTVRIRLDNAGTYHGSYDGTAYYSGANIETAVFPSSVMTNQSMTLYNYYNGQEIYTGAWTSSGQTFVCGLVTAKYAYATAGEQDADDPTKYWITAIEGVSSITSLQGDPGWVGRALITYLVMEGGMLMSEIFDAICDAAGVSSTQITSTREVGIMRCGGSYFHNYLLALADMDEPTGTYAGRQHAFACQPTSWGSIRLGYRRRASDSSVATLYYAGDSAPSSSAIPFASFAPTKTLKYRPYLAVTRGTKDDGTPIILAMRDPAVDIGPASALVDGSITEVADAAMTSYSEISTNRSRNWEGQLQLSGIYTDFMEIGTYVGGAPVRIYDSRYGMSAYQARVKEVQLDFTNQTTTLTLNNYSEVYSNSVVDSSKMAYSAGNLAVEASSSDLFTLQYVRIESTATLSSRTTHTIEIYSAEGGYVSANADVVEISELGVAVLSAYFRRGVGSIVTRYGITRVRVDGSTVINIDSAIRPDKYSNQALIVNVQMDI